MEYVQDLFLLNGIYENLKKLKFQFCFRLHSASSDQGHGVCDGELRRNREERGRSDDPVPLRRGRFGVGGCRISGKFINQDSGNEIWLKRS